MISIKYIPNILKDEGRIKKEFEFSRSKTIKDYLELSGYSYDPEKSKVIVSGKKIDDFSLHINDGDEITITPDIAFAAIFGFLQLGTFWATLGTILDITLLVASIGFSIYSMLTTPRAPSYSTLTPSGSIDESSPTYGWSGIATTMDVGTPVPVVYGEHRVGGNVINSWVRADGDKNYLNVLLGLCEGEIQAIAENTGELIINNNPSENFDGISVSRRYGTKDQSVISNFEDSHNLYAINAELTKNNPYVYTTVDSDVEGFEVHLQSTGGIFGQDDNGTIISWTITYKVEYKLHVDSTYILADTINITEKMRNTVRRIYRKTGLPANKYDIKVTRTSDDSALSPMRQGDLTWTQVDEIKTDDFRYPYSALIGVEALASDQLSGAMPDFGVIVRGKKVKVPYILNGATEVDWEDYYWDPLTEEYKLLSNNTVLSWDGTTYVDRWSANPVWCLKDLLTHGRYGLGQYINVSSIDEPMLLEMSQYCEERVPDGLGGYEKRFRLDIVLDGQSKALDAINQICSSFRGLPFYSGGTIKIKIDKPENPVQLFTMGNISINSFNQSWKSIKEVPNVIEVQFLDKNKNYEQDTALYEDPISLANGDPVRTRTIRLFTTSLSQVMREARYALKLAKYINRTITFKAFIDAIACQPGDVISVSHDVPQWGFSGRCVEGGELSKVVLDREFTIEDGKSYKVMVQFKDDKIEEKNVTNPAGTYTYLTVDTPFTQIPDVFDKYSVGLTTAYKKDFRIVAMKKNKDLEVDISCIEYDARVYDDSAITLPTSNYSMLDLSIPTVTSLYLTEQLIIKGDGRVENAIDVWFDIPDFANYVKRYSRAKIYLSEDNIRYEKVGETTGKHYQISGNILDKQIYYVKVVTVTDTNEEGQLSSAPSNNITVVGKSAPPSDVESFLVNQSRDGMYFGWTPVDDLDVKSGGWYEIRRGIDWDSGELVTSNLKSDRWFTNSLKIGVDQSYWIKAVDSSGNYSTNATEAVVTVDEIPFRNIVITFSEQSTWYGTKSNLEKSGNNLIISSGQLSGTYTTGIKDVGYVASFRIILDIICAITQGMAFNSDGVTRFNSISNMRFTGIDTPGVSSLRIKTSEDNITWTDWKDYQFGDYKCRYYQLEMTLTRESTSINLLCSQFEHVADLPDVDDKGSDEVTVAATGKAVVFSKTYHEAPNVHIEILTGSGVYYRFPDKDTTGFTVILYDAAGSEVTGTFDWHSHGI